MDLDAEQCYRALRAHDARFDGRFFVGVATTRIYCRPVCAARTPHREHCRFFPSAAAAEASGFRPCLRCRPELAPGFATVDASRRLAQAAASRIDDGHAQEAAFPEIAAALGVTDRHLRRVFRQEFGVTPVAYAQTQRLLLAKRLLTDTSMPIVDVALASGFSSLRRFNHLFRTRYRMTPGALRHDAPSRAGERIAFELAYRPPYDWDAMLGFLSRRAIPGVEAVQGKRYQRTLRLERHGREHAGIVEVAPSKRRDALRVSMSPSLAGALPAVLARMKQLFDVDCRPDEIATVLGPLAADHPGLRLPGAADGFEVAVRAIVGQQVTVAAASTLCGRFVTAFGEPLEEASPGLHALFPRASAVAALEPAAIARCGIVPARARAIVSLAREVAAGRLVLDPGTPVEAALAALHALPGIGPWTAQYIAMRALAWPDAFPHPDVAVLKAMAVRKPADAPAFAERWRPWRSYAVIHLWKSLEKKP